MKNKFVKGLLIGFCILLATTILGSSAWGLTWTFTTGGATGAYGPSQSALDTAYLGTSLEGMVTSSAGVQLWVVPYTGVYRITATGAQGASGDPNYVGGRGAQIAGDFSFTAGDLLQLVVGQMGVGQSSGSNGGGGGGSFVVNASDDPLLVAGGGGGTRAVVYQNGTDASITEYAYRASGGSGSYTPTLKTTGSGQGGIVSSLSWGSGGAGFYSDGADDGSWGDGGHAWNNGMLGGIPPSCGAIAYGGFGGGGSGNGCYGGGGGGGYSGGDGGRVAGGGGSFNLGINPEALAGVGYGDGSIFVELLTAQPVPEPASMLLLGSGLIGLAGIRRKFKS